MAPETVKGSVLAERRLFKKLFLPEENTAFYCTLEKVSCCFKGIQLLKM